MLATGRRRVARAGLGDRIELVEGRAQELPFDDASFDGVTATYVLRYVEDVAGGGARARSRRAARRAPIGYLDFGVPPLPPGAGRLGGVHPRGPAARRTRARRTAGSRSGAS